MLPRPWLDLSGTPGLRPIGLSPGSWQTSLGLGSMSRYSTHILICIAYLSLAFSWDLWAYRFEEFMTQIGTSCTTVFYIFFNWWWMVDGGWHTLFCITNNRHLLCPKHTFNYYAPLLYLDEDGEPNSDTLVSWCFRVNMLFIDERDKENNLHLDCDRSIPVTRLWSGMVLHIHSQPHP